MIIQFIILAIFTLVAFYHDARFQKIPNWLTGSGVIIGFIVSIILYGFINGLIFSGLGLIVGTVILLLLYFIKGVGAGDVKLFSAIGAMTGVEFSLYCLMYSILIAGLIAMVLLVYRIPFVKRMITRLVVFLVEKTSKKEQSIDQWIKQEIAQFPFMYAVLPGVMITIYFYL